MSPDLSVLILGLGASGLAMARWCARRGAAVSVWDSREQPPGAAALAAEWPAVQRLAALPASVPAGSWVLKSPGLAPRDGRIAPLLDAARAAGATVQGELDLFVGALADLKRERGYAPRIVAVTGTNGKTTTTAMTALLVERAGRSVATAGNIGPTLLDTLAAHVDGGTLPDVWVLELSSFQLDGGGDGVAGFDPDAAALLNLTQDHLDWHGDMAAYARAKSQVFGPRTVVVANRGDAAVQGVVRAVVAPPPAVKPTARAKAGAADGGPRPARGAARAAASRRVVTFGIDAPPRPGDWGVVDDAGVAWLARARPGDDAPRRRRAAVGTAGAAAAAPAFDAAPSADVDLQRLMPVDAMRVRGRHNAANALAALALADAIGCALAPMLHGLREYRGEPHRLQFVARVDDVDAWDDSKGTNVGATVAALEGLGADIAPARVVAIVGGDGKGQDFAPLAAPLARHARAVATIGRDAAAIEAAVGSALGGVPIARHASLEDAVAWGYAQARAGDALLLSPACASFDMFRNYVHRGEAFAAAVHAHAAARGVTA